MAIQTMNIIVALAHNSISIVFELFALFVFLRIVCPRSKISRVIEFNLSIKLYILSTITFCAVSIPLQIYYYIVWPGSSLLNGYFVWWAGMIQSMALMAIPITVLFLSIDRCLIITYPHSGRVKTPIIISLTVISILAACGVSIWWDDAPAYGKQEWSTCRDFTCLLGGSGTKGLSVTLYLLIKLGITCAIVIAGTVCVFLVRKKLQGTSSSASLNKIIFLTLANTVIFDIGPYLIDLVLFYGFSVDLNLVLGPYRTFMAALDAGLCALSYFKVINKKMKAKRSTPVMAYSKADTSRRS